MVLLLELWEKFRTFMEVGGDVLIAIFVVTLAMWILIVERFWYMSWVHPGEAKKVVDDWKKREDHTTWCALHIRRQQISELDLKMTRSLSTIKTLIAVCPLLGLLETVTGMIEVFTIMALVGSGNARAMASGVSMATIPTMAGMVAALSGMYFSARLDRVVRRKMAKVKDSMPTERGETCAVA